MWKALSDFAKDKKRWKNDACIVLDEAHGFVQEGLDLARLLAVSTKEYRKFGLGHVFIDQSLAAISKDLQIQTFFLGHTTTPAEVNFMREQLGEEVVSAAQRTVGTGERRSWVACGAATPQTDVPWEFEAFAAEDLKHL